MATQKSVLSTIAVIIPILVLGMVAMQSSDDQNVTRAPGASLNKEARSKGPTIVRAGDIKAADVVTTISTGEEIDIQSYLRENEYVVFAFLGRWSKRSTEVAKKIEDYAMARRNTYIYLIDLDSWESEVCRQCKIHAVPTLWMYKGSKCISEKLEEVIELVRAH